MIQGIDEREKARIFQFVEDCELEYDIIDNGIAKPFPFRLFPVSYLDEQSFYFG